MSRLCMFDLDGTVLDTLGAIAHFANRALVHYGIEPIEEERYRYFAGQGAADLVRAMLVHRGVYSDELHAAVFAEYTATYHADPVRMTRHFDGLPEVLSGLRSAGIALSVVSNKPEVAAVAVTDALFGHGFFDPVIGQGEGRVLKPDPFEVYRAMRQHGATAASSAFVGDTATDMRTGRRAGLFTVGVTWGFRPEAELWESGADAVAHTPRELLEVLSAFFDVR